MQENKKEKLKIMFLSIQEELTKNKSTLIKAIEKVSYKLKLKKESAKNYYYKNLKYLRENLGFAKEIGVDLNNFEKKDFEKFNLKTKEELFNKVNENLKKGISVRQTCMQLSNNDAKLMLRLQNKYRNMLKQKNKGEQKLESIEKDNKVISIIKAKQELNKNITDNEINALFMGLIKIVKKAAIENANAELKSECLEATQNFRQTIVDLNKKEMELKKAYELNQELNLKVKNQQEQICLLLDKLSRRKITELEKKSKDKYLKLKGFNKNSKNDNIL
ncbi:MAG: hypothetical protein IJW32_02785 [Clostridia bacterium]|nr:hypothetical protein [Clostridia bacterium]